MISKYYDKILLVGALMVLLGVFGLAAFRPDPQPITEFVDIPTLRPENTYVVSELPKVDLAVPAWEEAPAQSAGPEWVFDVFTPPVILFDTTTGEFVLTGREPEAPREFGLELVSIQEELYRVQIVGYFGRDGNYLVTLENVETGDQILVRQGQEYGNFGIVIRSIRTERVEINHGGATSVSDDVAFVVLDDTRLGDEVLLRSDERKRDSEPTAVFQVEGNAELTFRGRAGESFRHEDVLYRIDSLHPPETAVITRTGGDDDDTPETRTLRVIQSRTGLQQTPNTERERETSRPTATQGIRR
jgi:hypothetical protein